MKGREKGPLGIQKRRWMDNIKMHVGDIGMGCMYWLNLAHDRDHYRSLVNAVIKLRIPKLAEKLLSSCTTVDVICHLRCGVV
jgi:hypothetical protein